MNPHDTTKRPEARRVAEMSGIEAPFAQRPPGRRTAPAPDDQDLLSITREASADLQRRDRAALSQGRRDRGIRVSNRRPGTALQSLCAECVSR
ncbi:hypothetical protein [Streptomyces nigrescens]|uniref:hypothetical protein n=1 Tax=Streptomyces nigrescens TaxID=1920 RepID=UPI00224DD636|nr:hypothetical protein [Streptomyces libani]MCX5449860.1 hypothetical protein [Streptomyces libani]